MFPSRIHLWLARCQQSRSLQIASAGVILVQRSPLLKSVDALQRLVIPSFAQVAKFAAPVTVFFGGVHAATGASVEVIPIQSSKNPASGTVGTKFTWIFDTKGETAENYTFTGTFPPGVAWSKKISSGISTLTGTPTQAGTYKLNIFGWEHTGNKGDKTPAYALTITITGDGAVVEAPKITTQPSAGLFALDAAALLKVVATGTDLKYQWQKDGQDIAEATAVELKIAKFSAADEGSYQVLVSNSAGSVPSEAVKVALAPPAPKITSQPLPGVYAADAAVVLKIAASGSELHYQWEKDGEPIPEADGTELTIAKFAAVHAGSYQVSVTNSGGSTLSTAVKLALSPAGSPIISTQPTGGAFLEGSAASLKIVAAGTDLKYQWQKSGQAIAKATTAELAIAKFAALDAGSYRAVITNAKGSVTSVSVELTLFNEVDAWRAAHWKGEALQDEKISGLAANPDGDAWSNLLEFAFGSDPTLNDAQGLPIVARVAEKTGDFITVTVPKPASATVEIFFEAAALGATLEWQPIAVEGDISLVEENGQLTLRFPKFADLALLRVGARLK